MSFAKLGRVNRWTEEAPSIPAYRNWLSPEMARTLGLVPAGTDEVIVQVEGSKTEIVLGFVPAVPVTER